MNSTVGGSRYLPPFFFTCKRGEVDAGETEAVQVVDLKMDY